jgi:hypothetical protein
VSTSTRLASARLVTHAGKGIALGLDVAGPGTDLAPCWSICDGRAKLEWWVVHNDLMDTADRVARTVNDYEGRVKVVCIDDTGIGGGVTSRLRQLQRWERSRLNSPESGPGYLSACTIVAINFGQEPRNPAKFRRAKDELWWTLSESLKKTLLGLPPDSELAKARLPKGNSLIAQLVSAIYETDASGRIKVYDRRDPKSSSEKLKALPTKSPDLAHSLMLANWGFHLMRAQWDEEQPRTILEKRAKEWRERIKKDIQQHFRPDERGPDNFDFC